MKRYAAVLRGNPEYAKLWLAQVVSLTGDWFGTVVLSTLVAALSDGSGLALSLFFLSRFVPPLLLSAHVGVITDRYNRKHVLVVSNLSRALIIPLFLLVNTPDLLWLVYVVSIAQAVMSALFEPAQSAILPSLLKDEDLIYGNTLLNVTWSAMLAIGAAAGGLFTAGFGATAALLVNALTFLLAGALTAWIAYDPMRRRAAMDRPKEQTSFADGLRFLRRHPPLIWTLLVKGATSLGNVDTLLAVLATQVFVLGNRGELSLSILYAVFGVGAFFGPLVMNRWNNGSLARMRLFVLIGFALAFVAWWLMGLAGSLVFLAAAVLLRGVGGSINWTFSSVMVQRQTPDAYLGRMFSIDYAFFYAATILSTLVHGALVDVLGVAGMQTILFGTALVAALPLLTWGIQLPRLNRMKIAPSGD
jgi:MFS family permease